MGTSRRSARPPAPEASDPAEGPPGARALALIFALALAARLAHAWVAGHQDLLDGLLLDSRWYADRAADLRLGRASDASPYLLSPLYPYVLAVFTDPAGALDLVGVRWLQACAGSIAAVFAAVLAGALSGRKAAWIAGLAAAGFGPSIHYGALVLTPALQSLLLIAGVATATLGLPRARAWVSWLAAGVLLGLAAAIHPTSLAAAAGLAGASLLRAWARRREGFDARALARQLGAFAGGLCLAIAPFTARNLAVSGEPVLLSANAGMNFWIGNHAGARGVFETPEGYDAARDPVGRELAERARGTDTGWTAASRWWSARAWSDIAADPAAWIGLLGRKLLLFLHATEIRQIGDGFDWFAERSWPLRLPLDARTALLLCLAAPIALALRGRRADRIALPLGAVVLYALGVCAFFVTGRYRAPLMPLVLALAAIGGLETARLALGGAWARSRGALAYLLALGALFAASQWLYTGPLAFSKTGGVESRHLGLRFAEQGRWPEAVAQYREALALHDDAATRTNLAVALRQLGDVDAAIEQCRRALELDPRLQYAWFKLGVLLWIDKQDHAGAEQALRRATELMPRYADARYNLGLVLLQLGRREEAAAEVRAALDLAGGEVEWRAGAEAVLGALVSAR